jgi:hypothetical protein
MASEKSCSREDRRRCWLLLLCLQVQSVIFQKGVETHTLFGERRNLVVVVLHVCVNIYNISISVNT